MKISQHKTAGLLSLAALTLAATSASATMIVAGGGSAGAQGNTSVTFTASNLAAHSAVTVNFDLTIFDSWDGGPVTHCCGSDTFGIRVDGIEVFNATFDNIHPLTSHETNTETASSTGNFNHINTWGPIDRHFVDYAGGFVFAHTASTIDVTFFGHGLQHMNDESWSLSNVDIATAAAVPEPGSLALLSIGLLGLRRSRKAAAGGA